MARGALSVGLGGGGGGGEGGGARVVVVVVVVGGGGGGGGGRVSGCSTGLAVTAGATGSACFGRGAPGWAPGWACPSFLSSSSYSYS
jgi:hypothetical protein